jgi:arylsulfatase A-like enzyme
METRTEARSRPRRGVKAGVAALFVIAVVALLSLFLLARPEPKDKPRLNVLLITLDTTRADRLGCYGYTKPTTPNIDALAGDSVVFDQAIAQSAVTPVSHASIFTGLDPHRHGLRVLHGSVGNVLEKKNTTLAEMWKAAGGQTSAFISAYPAGSAYGLDQGYSRFDEDYPQPDGPAKGWMKKGAKVTVEQSQRLAKDTTDAAIDWLRNKARRNKPIHMWVHYFDPHDPMMMPPQDEMPALAGEFAPASKEPQDQLRAIYDCEVHYMDKHLGRLLDEFKQAGLWENTIVVVVADHGEGLGDHNWWSHGILYQEQIHVPLIIRIPGYAQGTRVESLVRTTDILPTVLEAAGVSPERWSDIDGLSLTHALETGSTEDSRTAYADSMANLLTHYSWLTLSKEERKNDKYYCLIREGKKLIYHQRKPSETEFYDLAEDPGELSDLAGERAGEVEEMVEELRQMDPFCDITPGMTASEWERARKLKSLGYVE